MNLNIFGGPQVKTCSPPPRHDDRGAPGGGVGGAGGGEPGGGAALPRSAGARQSPRRAAGQHAGQGRGHQVQVLMNENMK